MDFEKVTAEHIFKGIEDFNEKGMPVGYRPSSAYDLIYEGKLYPPKAVMAYANFHAIGRKIEGYFRGGLGTDCFKAYERNGFQVISKESQLTFEHLYKLKEEFLNEWSVGRLEALTIDEYTNLDKTSFCYWMEHITEATGGIKGGSSYKFGIYRMGESSGTEPKGNRTNDGIYAWYIKYGKTRNEAFFNIKDIILKIIKASIDNNLDVLDDIDLGDAYKWKIAFMYSDYNVMNIFSKPALIRSSMGLGEYADTTTAISKLNRFIIQQKPKEEDFYGYSQRIWATYGHKSERAKEFEVWLKSSENKNSKKSSSYIRALTILNNFFKIAVYDIDSISELNDLYEDLKEHQTDPNGKYFHPTAVSYGRDRFYSAAVKSYIEFFTGKSSSLPLIEIKENTIDNNKVLNTILYGPPGTGKTFNTVNLSLGICGESIEGLNRKEIKDLYDLKMSEGQIIFTTFHQSMSYEDFIEGIKPMEPEKEGDPVVYKVVDGIFKKACIEAAFNFAIDNKDTDTDKVLDFSLVYDNFIQKLEERLASESEVELEIKNGGKVYVDSISAQGNIQIKHLEGLRTYTVSKTRLTKLQKAIANLDEISNINDSFRAIIGGSNSTAYWSVLNAIQKENINKNYFNRIERKYSQEEKREVVKELDKNIYKGKSGKPIVLIIDEINRGNVSAIFGELITLIEKDKRLGADEALLAQLPYSKEVFGVPPNLYIIGTMNTADRSVEALDSALRRRFSFTEMPSIPSYVAEHGLLVNGIIDDIDLVVLLKTLNKRIEKLLDKDHTIGHSYFLKIMNIEDLKAVIGNKVIPLLQEYFFGDYGKIGLVMGNGFVDYDTTESDEEFFATFEYEIGSLLSRKVYKIKDALKMDNVEFKEALRKLIG
ncbi:AAA family ATPase [Maribacter confluentis]|uniref:AAA family ATPase n=1 Tax=Maribacter confluentis TaxID=1656093 RepID=A0ABT8RV78_9FLAO|nr:AAA family ATPase [Maribacter confluentis]MDO1514349.1 AAA family ATPase [Maribacter confluentis]